MARELWLLAKGTGTRPSELLLGKAKASRLLPMEALAIDLTVMRGARAIRKMDTDRADAADDSGWNAIVTSIRSIAEDW